MPVENAVVWCTTLILHNAAAYQVEQRGTLDEVLEEHSHAHAALVVTLQPQECRGAEDVINGVADERAALGGCLRQFVDVR